MSFPIKELKTWFQREARPLPWRQNPTPYAVWVSEIMLQQTQVSVVKDYFLRWMERFPTISALASASIEEVIKMWEGLGYYSRARNLHQGAQLIVKEHGGELPSTQEALKQIKGLGPYTVGAILSFAFHQRQAAVDGNVLRVLSRYFCIEEDIGKSKTQQQIWSLAQQLLPKEEPWLIVEGLIELGATLCQRDPKCFLCPLHKSCKALQKGIADRLPIKEKKSSVTLLTRHVMVITHQDRVLLKKPTAGKVMADLYEFPYYENEQLSFPFGLTLSKAFPEVQHSFTRYRATLLPTLWIAQETPAVPGYDWVDRQELKNYPFSAGHRRILKLLERDYAHITH